MKAKPEDLLDATGEAFDTDKAFRVMMRNEKPGGHGDRAHAVAAVELALWDLNAKLAGVPAWKLIADKFGVAARERMPVYAAGGYYYPEDSLGRLKDEMRGYGDMGYTSFKMKIGGAPLAEDMTPDRGRARRSSATRRPRGRRQRPLRYPDRDRLRQGDGRIRPPLVRGAGRPARLPAHGRPRRGL